MKPIERKDLVPSMRIRIYYAHDRRSWTWIQGVVWGDPNNPPRLAQVVVVSERLDYSGDASNIGHVEIVKADDLIFLLENGE